MPKRTPLYDEHIKLKAKMVWFAGWDMPVSYSGIIEEHMFVREAAGLFDVGHMGIVEISGPDALPFVQKIATNDASSLPVLRSQYSILCNPRGGVIDDILVYRLPDKFMIVVNASNTEKDLAWFAKNASGKVKIEHREDLCLLSLQGPKSELILSPVCDINLKLLKRNSSQEGRVFEKNCMVSRTGYTGDDGFELFLSTSDVKAVWSPLLEKGVVPCGLGARDTLRIEAGLPLYLHEYTEDISPLEAGYGWAVKFQKGDFIGREALLKLRADGIKNRLVGIEFGGRTIPRQGFNVCADSALKNSIGTVTSGTYSPLLKMPIAMAYVITEFAKAGGRVFVDIRGKAAEGKIIELPFYKKRKL